MKLFISYSHKDEQLKKQLDTQLSILQRNKVITSWHDRKIVAGQEWESEIDNELEKSDIVLLLISADFLASDYCYEKEMGRAIEKHNNNETIVVPVILRPCDWKETPFSKLQVLPKDAKAISKWSDNDEAWLNVIDGLKNTIKESKETQIKEIIQEKIWGDSITQGLIDWLNDTEIKLVHRRVNEVKLEDIYIIPDLKVLGDNMDKHSRTVSSKYLLGKVKCSVVFGDEQSGKTSLAKYYFKELINKGCWPIYINGEDIKASDITKLIEEKSKEQYSKSFNYNNAKNRAVIVDNFSNNKLNKKYQNKLISQLKETFEKVILFSIDSFQYVAPEIDELDDFEFFEILNFGNVKRTELIEKWISLGCIEEIDEKDLYTEIDDIKIKVEGLARGNILPSKPIYLLTLLQMFESISPQKVELTSYGHCYQYLIYQSLEKARIKNSEVDVYMNFLTELGCAQFNNDGEGLDQSQIESFHHEYEKKYLSIDIKKIIDDLVSSGILLIKNDLLRFKYSYIYYYFTAKKLAESFSNDPSAKKDIQKLLENLHREDCSNIIIFITHHSRDNWILDEIQMCLMELFGDEKEAELNSQSLEFMKEFIEEIPELVIEHKKVEEERKNMMKL